MHTDAHINNIHVHTDIHTHRHWHIYTRKLNSILLNMPKIHSEGGKETPLMNNNRICFFFFLPPQLPIFVGTVNDSLPLHAQQLCSPTLLLNSFWHLKSRWGRERHSVKSSASLSPAASACNCQSGLRETENNTIAVHFLLRENGERTVSREGKTKQREWEIFFHSFSFLSLFVPSLLSVGLRAKT